MVGLSGESAIQGTRCSPGSALKTPTHDPSIRATSANRHALQSAARPSGHGAIDTMLPMLVIEEAITREYRERRPESAQRYLPGEVGGKYLFHTVLSPGVLAFAECSRAGPPGHHPTGDTCLLDSTGTIPGTESPLDVVSDHTWPYPRKVRPKRYPPPHHTPNP